MSLTTSPAKFAADITFDNPYSITVGNIYSSTFGIGFNNALVATTTTNGFSVGLGNQTIQLRATTNFEPGAMTNLFSVLMSGLNTNGFSILGPVDVQPLGFVHQITPGLNLALPPINVNSIIGQVTNSSAISTTIMSSPIVTGILGGLGSIFSNQQGTTPAM
jgi:hypothetical protein